MKNAHGTFIALAAALALAGPAGAQQTTANPTQVMDAAGMAKAVTISATVTAIDLKNRIVTLKAQEGDEFAVMVDPSVKNLPKLRVGDMVDATYIRAVAIDFQKGDGIRMAVTTDASQARGLGGRPGSSAMTRVTLVSNIWAMDAAKGTVTVRGPFGHFVEVQLRDPAQLNGVKVGDQMKVTYTQAVATSLVRKS